jgi:heat shock protein HslJ
MGRLALTLLAASALGVLGACGDDGETVTDDDAVQDTTTTVSSTTTTTLAPTTTTTTAAPTTTPPVEDEEPDPGAARPLEGGWRVEGIVDGETSSSVPDGSGATITFGPGEVGMTIDGCNTGGSAVQVNGQEIEVEGLISTMIACTEPAATVESAVVGVLEGTITYEIEDDQLTLTHPGGNGLTLQAE